MPAAWTELWATPAVRGELRELLVLLEDARGRSFPLEHRLPPIPLSVHATYGLDEVMAALDERDKKGRIKRLREGVFHSKMHRADLLFVTLNKSEADYSPTTMYRDFALSPLLDTVHSLIPNLRVSPSRSPSSLRCRGRGCDGRLRRT